MVEWSQLCSKHLIIQLMYNACPLFHPDDKLAFPLRSWQGAPSLSSMRSSGAPLDKNYITRRYCPQSLSAKPPPDGNSCVMVSLITRYD